MLILLEGPDGGGKSTLARALADELPEDKTEVRHCGQPKQHPLVEYERDLDSYEVDDVRSHVIYDRHYLGELVYGPLYRGRSQLDQNMLAHVEMYLNSRGAVLVHVTHDVQVLRDRCRREGEDFLQDEDVAYAKRTFDQRVSSTRVRNVVTVTDASGYEIELLLRRAERAENECQELASFTTYVGPPHPRVLLLGERRGPTNPGHSSAFVPYPYTSGSYLLKSLPSSMLDSCGVANACEEDVEALWHVLGRPSVVALGRAAHQATPVAHSQVPHPQWVRRFAHKKHHDYGQLIDTAGRYAGDYSGWRG